MSLFHLLKNIERAPTLRPPISEVKLKLCLIFQKFQNCHHFDATRNFFTGSNTGSWIYHQSIHNVLQILQSIPLITNGPLYPIAQDSSCRGQHTMPGNHDHFQWPVPHSCVCMNVCVAVAESVRNSSVAVVSRTIIITTTYHCRPTTKTYTRRL